MSRLTSAAMFELIIFDMDGVLVDSEDAMAQMTVRALEEWGIHSSPDDFTRFRGMGDRAYVGGVSEMYGVPYEERMKEEAYRRGRFRFFASLSAAALPARSHPPPTG